MARRRPLSLIITLSVFTAIVGSVHVYFALRFLIDTGVAQPWRGVGYAWLVGLALSIFVYPFAEQQLGARASRGLAWPMFMWLGAAFYLLIGLWASDFVLLVLGLAGEHVARVRALAVAGVATAVVAVGHWNARRGPERKRVEIKLAAWPAALDGYRIVQLSDIHISALIRRDYAQRVVDHCAALAPDLIAVTGDLVDGSVRSLRDEVAPFADLRARDGVFFVTGNHDFYSDEESWVERVRELGMTVLRNERISIARGDARFELAGVDDYSTHRRASMHGLDLQAATDGWNAQIPLVLLAHDPRTFERARELGVHLQLSGHTHAGQMWPFRFFVRVQTRWIAGLYRSGASQLYVSRGTGFWGPPIRFARPAEITEIVLRPAV
jgi:predicted MPP superfamily phosphohydrolase